MHLEDPTHHHDESTRGVKTSRSKIKTQYILGMALGRCWPLVPGRIPMALPPCDARRENMSPSHVSADAARSGGKVRDAFAPSITGEPGGVQPECLETPSVSCCCRSGAPISCQSIRGRVTAGGRRSPSVSTVRTVRLTAPEPKCTFFFSSTATRGI